MARNRKKFWKRFDYILFLTVVFLSVFGLVVISSATAGGGNTKAFDNGIIQFIIQFFQGGSIASIKGQGAAFLLGIVAIIVTVMFNYDNFGKLYLPIYIFCNLLLLAVILFGTGEEEWGARSWLVIAGKSFQPSELVKIGTILSVAKFMEKNKENINQLFTLIKVLIFSFIPVGLILMQPDFGTALVFIFFIAAMLYIVGLDYKYFFFAAIAGIASLPVLWFSLEEFQKNRILDFLDPSRNALGSGYQVTQSKIAIGSGQVFGRGLFRGVQTQYGYIPEKDTDFIFAVIGEELGLIGGAVLIVLYFIMLYRLVRIAKNAKDLYGSLIVIGITAMMVFHILENIGMTMGLMPVTGIPLPFISRGGTFLLSNMICIGLALGIGMRKDKLNF